MARATGAFWVYAALAVLAACGVAGGQVPTINFAGLGGVPGTGNPWVLPARGRIVCTKVRLVVLVPGTVPSITYGGHVEFFTELTGAAATAAMPVYRYDLPPTTGAGYTGIVAVSFGAGTTSSTPQASTIMCVSRTYVDADGPIRGTSACGGASLATAAGVPSGQSMTVNLGLATNFRPWNYSHGVNASEGITYAYVGPAVAIWSNPSPGVFSGWGWENVSSTYGLTSGGGTFNGFTPAQLQSGDCAQATVGAFREVVRYEIEADVSTGSMSTEVPEGWYDDVLTRLTDIRAATQSAQLLLGNMDTTLGVIGGNVGILREDVSVLRQSVTTNLPDIVTGLNAHNQAFANWVGDWNAQDDFLRTKLEEMTSGSGQPTGATQNPAGLSTISKASDVVANVAGNFGEGVGASVPEGIVLPEGDAEAFEFSLNVPMNVLAPLGYGPTIGNLTVGVDMEPYDVVVSWVRMAEVAFIFVWGCLFIWEELRKY